MADDDGSSVRVAVRIRPLIGREKVERCDECVSVLEEENQIVMGKNRAFTYDYVFGKYAQQSDIWRCVDPLINATFDGYNSTIFAYGQTGSGKTYTMGSGSSVHIPPEDYGIIPRVISYMFDQIDAKTQEKPHFKTVLKIRFLEIYGEEIHDLLVTLGDSSGESKVSLREAENGEVQVTGASEVEVVDSDECMRLLERGTLCRTTGSTLMNAHSSRSHAIFTVTMVQHIPIGEPPADGNEMQEGDYETRNSYFNFVDLAGSERQKRTQAEGKRLKEGIDINKGLLALGNVISALGDDKKRGKVHVPYRDSKLTRMLQDSLGGNSRTLMLTCVSPADVNFEETLNALKYANRARNIQNKPVVNRDEASAMTMELRRQVQMLQMEVHRLRNPGLSESELKMETVGTNFIGMASDFDSFGNLRTRAENAENEVGRLTAELKRGKTQLDHLKEEMIAAQAERDYLRLCVEESAGGSSISPEERESKSNVLKDQLRTICELQEKLRATERERDNAVMSFPGSVSSGSSGARPQPASPFALPSLAEVDTKVGNELLERAEKEIERETALLNKLKGGESGDDAGAESDGSGAEGNGSADGMEVEEENQEEADRMHVFQRRQRHLGESVQDLAHDISLKEQLVQNIRQAQENYDRMKSFYEQKMAEMVEEVHAAQVDRDHLVDEIQQIEKKASAEGDTSGGNVRLAKLSRDLKVKEEELQALRKKQNDINRFMNQKKKNETQLRVLNSEISNMKRQKVDLVKKMQEERKRYEEEAKQRRREIMSLKRSQQRDKQQIQRLGSQKDAQERVLKRKMEEVSAAKQRLKHQQQLTAQARKMNATHGRKKNAGANRADRDAKWLSEEVKKRAEEQQKLEQLQKEREAVAKEMEALYAQRDKLEKEVKSSISSQTNIRDVLTSPMQNSPLSRRNSGRQEQQLTPAEEQLLYDLEERIEACHAQLEYKEEKISEISDDVRIVEGGNALAKIETTQSLPEARTLLKMLFSMAVDVKKQDQRKEQELAKQHVEMEELVRHLEQEREKTMQIKQSYEESLQRVVNGGMNDDESSPAHEPLDERSRILLSVSEERNSVLRKKCEELETISRTIDQEKLSMEARLQQEQEDLAASRERVRYLETKLKKLSKVAVGSSQTPRRSRIPVSAPNKFSAVSQQAQSGPASWANELDDDEDMGTDDNEDDREHDGSEDVPMRSDEDENAQSSRSFGQDRRRFRMELENVGGSTEFASASSQKIRISQPRHGNEENEIHGDDGGDDGTKEDSPHMGSDDSSSTTNSIFSRLSNPTNFTGIHKNRVRESASKREILQSRSERNRSRRLKDKGQLKRSANTPTEQFVGTPGGLKNPPSLKSNSVLEVLANMKRENESEQYVSSSGLRQPMSYVTTDRPRDYSSDDNELAAAPGSGAFSMMPPPAPQTDVYSRLAGQYTASAKSKRQRATTPARRDKGDEAEGSVKAGLQGLELEDDAYLIDHHGGEEANYTGSEDDSNYDPLLGGESLIKQVHDDYRERLAQRNADAGS
ncbi:Kinesin-like protein [Phytophthora fragariae]|uniref:Kinesin-like protein n=1 Tax=Phytophthora fragariae TaxID=53985 RepID=A0A6G0SI76_9STRA|nr:Kinesin-like protein [Phytophthora fragariae]